MPVPWHHKISNTSQLGGIETSVLDNGSGKGVRIAWINTGTGLRYKVVLDRAMDIADAFYNQHSLAWISHSGITAPQPTAQKGIDWIHTFGGGLLATCGLDHTGGPERDASGERGLHGTISQMPAQVESIVQPDLRSGNLTMSITGVIRQSRPLGARFELKRTISGELGKAEIRIHDEVTNCGNEPMPHMLLYHFNLGWPLLDESSLILWEGEWTPRESGATNRIFKPGNDFHLCKPPLDEHSGGGEEAAFVDAVADDAGICRCGIYNANLELALSLTFRKSQLPWLTNWLHFGKGEYVTGLEPGTNPPIGQTAARTSGQLLMLAAGETREYDLNLEVINNEESIRQFAGGFTHK